MHNILLLQFLLFTDYCGEVKVVLHNHSPNPIYFYTGDRIAQLIIEKIETCVLRYDDTIRNRQTLRQDLGFGSTDKNAYTNN